MDKIDTKESAIGYDIFKDLMINGPEILNELDTRQIEGKLWEIKFYRLNRIFYVLINGTKIFLLHACKKQKNKAELLDLKKAKSRMKEIKL